MRISVRIIDDVGIVALDGKFLAGSDGPFLRQKVRDLMDAGVRKFFLDFSAVPHIDSTGLGFLAGSRAAAEETGARIVLGGVNTHIRKILDEVKLSPLFTFAADESAAMETLKAAEPPGPERVSENSKRLRRATDGGKRTS